MPAAVGFAAESLSFLGLAAMHTIACQVLHAPYAGTSMLLTTGILSR